MSMTSWTMGDLQKLEAAIISGAQVVNYDSMRVEYRSLADMMRIRALAYAALGLTVPPLPGTTPVRTYPRFRSGFESC